MSLTPARVRTAAIPVATAALALSALAAAPASASSASYPVTGNIVEGIAQSLSDPAAPPPGVDVPGCVPSAAHPVPVVLVDGTFANMTDDWSGLGPALANLGYCVYATPLGAPAGQLIQTVGPVASSAEALSAYVDQVRAATGASKVDLVGHSQGGLIAEYYLKLLGGASKVQDLAALAPTTHGTTLDGLNVLASAFTGATALVSSACQACTDQLVGSSVVDAVDNGPIAQPGVHYTIIETWYEEVVSPIGSAFINEPGVDNIWLQDYCPFSLSEHVELPYDPGVQSLVEHALDPADTAPVTCS